jgi:electron transport complex protein RnfG
VGKNNYLKFSLTLLVICLASSALLSVIYNLTRPKILAQQKHEEEASLKEVFAAAASFEPVEEAGYVIYYRALDSDKKLCGYAFKAVKRGYSSDIATMVGLNLDGTISRIKILSQNETPGLGTRVTEVLSKETLWDVILKKVKVSSVERPWFQVRFDGARADDLKNAVPVITGATITSSAVIDSIEVKAKEVMEKADRG